MKILVSGATGFIGNHIVKELLSNNHDIVATGTDLSKAQQYGWFNKVNFIPYTIENRYENKNLFSFFDKPDTLIHLAWHGLPNYMSISHIDDNLFSQYNFLKNLINNGLTNVTVTGTCLEYGMQNGSLHEELIPLPSNPYAIAKDCLRRLVNGLQLIYEFSFKWVRLFYMYGAGQNQKSLISQLASAIRNNEKSFNMSGGEQVRDFLSVELVAKYIYKAAIQNEVKGIINCCSGIPMSVNQVVEKYIRELNSDIKLNRGYFPYPDYEPMEFWGDKTKLNKILSGL